MDYVTYVAGIAAIYAIVGWSLELALGRGGLVSVAHASLFGVGAYSYASLTVRLEFNAIASLFASIALGAVVGAILSLPAWRLRDDYFVLCTFVFQVLAFHAFENFDGVTGGVRGIGGIPRPQIGGIDLSSDLTFLASVSVLLISLLLLTWRWSYTTSAYALSVVREDEVFAKAGGRNTGLYKSIVLSVSGAASGLAGALYAAHAQFVDPSSFSLTQSVFFISVVVLGGAGSVLGPVAGVTLLIAFAELVRFMRLPPGSEGNIQQIIFGLILVILVVLRPKGLFGKLSFYEKHSGVT